MSKNRVIDSLCEIDDDMIQRVDALRRKKKNPAHLKWGVIAACLCLIVAFALPAVLHQPAESPNDTMPPSDSPSADGPPSLTVNGVTYSISPYSAVTDKLPDGFIHAGETSVGGFDDCPYYTNPDMPEWVYVYHTVNTDGTVDETGTLNRTEPHEAYVRYVDIKLRGRDLVCYSGEYYISMWSVQSYGERPDVSHEYFNKMLNTYGIRIEGEIPDEFVFAGTAEFSGYDTVPRGELSCNTGSYDVYVNPSDPDVILVSTHWYTATAEENGETKHNGFNIYIRYDCPLS